MRITGRQAIWLANRNVSGCVGRKALSSKLPEKLQALEILLVGLPSRMQVKPCMCE